MFSRLFELIVKPVSWDIEGLESLLSVVSCSDQRRHHDTAKIPFVHNSVPPGLSTSIRVGRGLKPETDRVQLDRKRELTAGG